jgi:hypothetical protein
MTIDKTASAIPFHDKSADRLRKTFKFSGPSSYATGGDAINPGTELGMSQIHCWLGNIVSNGTVVLVTFYDAANKKLKYFDMAGAEISAATNLSTYSGYAEVIGR